MCTSCRTRCSRSATITSRSAYIAEEVERLGDAVATVQGELVGLKAAATAGQTHSEVGAFVDLQMMMLADPMLIDAARTLIEERVAATPNGRWCSRWSIWWSSSIRSRIPICASARPTWCRSSSGW
jgi:hypothetical protein